MRDPLLPQHLRQGGGDRRAPVDLGGNDVRPPGFCNWLKLVVIASIRINFHIQLCLDSGWYSPFLHSLTKVQSKEIKKYEEITERQQTIIEEKQNIIEENSRTCQRGQTMMQVGIGALSRQQLSDSTLRIRILSHQAKELKYLNPDK